MLSEDDATRVIAAVRKRHPAVAELVRSAEYHTRALIKDLHDLAKLDYNPREPKEREVLDLLRNQVPSIYRYFLIGQEIPDHGPLLNFLDNLLTNAKATQKGSLCVYQSVTRIVPLHLEHKDNIIARQKQQLLDNHAAIEALRANAQQLDAQRTDAINRANTLHRRVRELEDQQRTQYRAPQPSNNAPDQYGLTRYSPQLPPRIIAPPVIAREQPPPPPPPRNYQQQPARQLPKQLQRHVPAPTADTAPSRAVSTTPPAKRPAPSAIEQPPAQRARSEQPSAAASQAPQPQDNIAEDTVAKTPELNWTPPPSPVLYRRSPTSDRD